MKKKQNNQQPGTILHGAYGTFNLAKPRELAKAKSIVMELQRTTDALTRKDILDWRHAWQMAINVDSPNRQRLYDIYLDVEIDLHLSGCVEQRKGFVLAHSFKLVDKNGKEDEGALHYFDQEWFKTLMGYCLDSKYWGHSLIELGDVGEDGDGCPCYSGVQLIPRKHVIPEYGRCVVNVGDDWTSGLEYRQPPFSDWLIEAGAPNSLGLYLKAATQTIPKKNDLAFWDSFAEIFGMPIRIAKTTSRDEKELNRLESMLRDGAHNLAMLLGAETEIQFVEASKGDSYNVYDRRIDRANSELSKLIIGQTMTIEDGSSLSQSQTHLKVFENLVEADRDMLRDIINNQLIPRMVKHGFPVKGLRFEWDDAIDYTPEQQIAFETMVADRYEVDPSYFADKYSMPVGQRITMMPTMNDDEGNDKKDDNDPKGKNPDNDDPDNPDGDKAPDGDDDPDGDKKPKGQKDVYPFFD